MGSFFDKLENEMEKREETAKKGFSPLDLADLDPPLRKLMKIMIRKAKLKYPEIIEVMKENEDFSQEKVDNTLEELVKLDWLIHFGEGESSTYKVNLGRRKASGLGGSVWAAIDKKLDERIKERQDQTKENKDSEQ